MKFAQKFVAGYLQGAHKFSASAYLKKNPNISSVRMINYSASAGIRELESQKEAAGVLHFFATLEISHEESYDLAEAMKSLVALIKSGDKPVQELGKVIDKHYKFDDER